MTLINRLFAAVLMFATLGVASAQTDPAVDPPGRVARLSEFTGQVWLYDPDAGEWTAAVRNRPVTAGDRVATDPGARAELQVGSTTVRLDSGTELAVTALDDERLSLELVDGSATARVADLAGAGLFDLSTDEGRFVVQRAGSYRFDRDGSTSRVTVYSGSARYEGPNSGLPVSPGQRAEFWIDSGGVAQYTLSAPVNDEFSAWNSDRDRRMVVGATARYVSPEMTGAEELDRYGRWEQSPEYGALWVPTAVAADWAPYRAGHWAWVRPWGWTWVDDAPWGFAPFHYGRWVYVRNNWCWTPGARVARPVYAPALVAWMGGPRANVSIMIGGGPAVGWFPLAPREVYVPSYRVSPRYVQNVNIAHVTNVKVINNIYNNPQAPREFGNRHLTNAVTIVPTGVMTSRQPVAPAAARVRQDPGWTRQIAKPAAGRGAVALIAPPVSAPPAPVRSVDPRAVRPPPGVAERPAAGRPGVPPQGQRPQDRDRDNRERDASRQGVPQRPSPPVAQTPAPAAPAAPAGLQRPGMVAAPPSDRGERRDDRRGGAEPTGPAPRALVPTPTPAPAIATPPAAAPAPQHAPTMRPLPVQRGEERRAPPRPPEAAPAADEPHAPTRVERPAPAMQAPVMRAPNPPARPVEAARPAPAEVQRVARPPEVHRPAPPVEVRRPAPPAEMPRPSPPAEVHRPAPAPAAVAPAPQVRRAEPPPRADGPGIERKRGEPGDQQR